MSEPKCPNCDSSTLSVERRPDGDARCAMCGWSGKYERCFEAPKKRECVTHHLACDCREEKFKQLEVRLKEANEVAEFYGADRNWHRRWKDNSAIDVSEEIDGVVDDEDLYWSEDRQMEVGGKRARAYLKKWEGEK